MFEAGEFIDEFDIYVGKFYNKNSAKIKKYAKF